MEKKKVIELATVNCSRISVYKKPLKTSREEMATIYVGEKFIDNVMPDGIPDVTIYGNTVEQIKNEIGSVDMNWSTHATIFMKEVSSEEEIFILWTKNGKEFLFPCKLMSILPFPHEKGIGYMARYMAFKMIEE